MADENYMGPGGSGTGLGGLGVGGSSGDRPTGGGNSSGSGSNKSPPPPPGKPKTPPTPLPAPNPKIITLTDSATFDNGVQDVSIIPYMRSQTIRFVASGLRPQRRVWFFFDDIDVTDYIIPTNEIRLNEYDNISSFNDGFTDADDIIVSANSQNKSFIHSNRRHFDLENANTALQDKGTDVPRKRIVTVSNVSGQIAISATIQGSKTSNVGTVNAVVARGDHNLDKFFDNSSADFITLPTYTSTMANNYWGTTGANNIVLVPKFTKGGRAIRGYISSWDNVSRRLTLSNTITNMFSDHGYTVEFPSASSGNTIGSQIAWKVENSDSTPGLYTDREGIIDGTFFIPPNYFRTGERVFRIVDTPYNNTVDCTTRAEVDFIASGLRQRKNKVTINDTNVVVVPGTPPTPPPVGPPPPPPPPPAKPPKIPPPKTPPVKTPPQAAHQGGQHDPIAQTFFVGDNVYPDGVFVTACDIFFRTKDPILPVNVEIRPTVNGFPHSLEMIPFSKKSINADKVNVSQDGSTATKFIFDAPIYLLPGEYAIVITSSSLVYEVFVSELGQKIIGTNRLVSEQPYLGSFFKSQNASTWDPIQMDDLTFKLYKAKFVTSGDVTMYNKKPNDTTNVDMVYSHVDDSILAPTAIAYTHSYDSGSNYYSYIPDTNRVLDARTTFGTTSDGSYRLKASMTTTNQDVSPILYTNKAGAIAVENYIDNAELANDDILVTVAGLGYATNANISISITSSQGSSANGYATTNTTGSIQSITLDNPGSGYINAASITFNSSNATTINASAIIVGENASSGGPVLTKYISRIVTLADTFDAGDLRIFVTAYKPPGTNFYVYYKVKNVNDSDNFSDKSWFLMGQSTLTSLYSTKKSYSNVMEYEFRPVGYPNAISYSTTTGTFDTFKQFAIKVVMVSNDTTTYPVLRDMRAIALPSMG